MGVEDANLATARRLLAALERGAPEEAMGCYGKGAEVTEHPSRIKPNGETRGVSAMAEGARRGAQLMARQRYEIVGEVAAGERVALEVIWTGELAQEFAHLKPGDVMTCRSAILMDFADGSIVRQQNYDCYPPF